MCFIWFFHYGNVDGVIASFEVGMMKQTYYLTLWCALRCWEQLFSI
nr:hypothetical protein [Gloeothece citriformis]